MDLRKIFDIKGWFGKGGRLDDHYSKNDKEIIANYKQLIEEKKKQIETLKLNSTEKISNLELKNTQKDNKILALNKEIEYYKEQLTEQDGIPQEFKLIRDFYDTKYPMKHITYNGRPIRYLDSKGNEQIYRPNVHVSSFIYDFQTLREYMSKKGLTFKKYIKEYKNFKTAMDKCREAIYDEVIRMRRYQYDSKLFGQNENWGGPWTAFFLKVNGVRLMDCESSTHLFMSMCKAAGVPRGFQRAVCGMTKGGYGHCAAQVYSFEQEEWKHYETTARNSMIFPAKQKTAGISFKSIWWSYDDQYSWSTEPASIVDQYKKEH